MKTKLLLRGLIICFIFNCQGAAAPKEGVRIQSYAGKIYEPITDQAKIIYPKKEQSIQELPAELKNLILEYVGDFKIVSKIKTTSKFLGALGVQPTIFSLLFLPNNKIAELSRGDFFNLKICDQINHKCDPVATMARTLNKIIKLPNNRIAYFFEDAPMGGVLKYIKIYNYDTKKYTNIEIDIDFHADAMAYLPGDKIALAGDQNVVKIYDLATKSKIKSFPIYAGAVSLYTGDVRDIISLDKDHLVVAVANNLIVYNVNSGAIVKKFRIQSSQSLLRLSDTRFISTSLDGYIKIWDMNLDDPIRQWNSGIVHSIDFYDENTVVTGSPYHIRFWDINSGHEINSILSENLVSSLAVSPNGDIAVGSGDQILIYRNLAKIFMDERKPTKK